MKGRWLISDGFRKSDIRFFNIFILGTAGIGLRNFNPSFAGTIKMSEARKSPLVLGANNEKRRWLEWVWITVIGCDVWVKSQYSEYVVQVYRDRKTTVEGDLIDPCAQPLTRGVRGIRVENWASSDTTIDACRRVPTSSCRRVVSTHTPVDRTWVGIRAVISCAFGAPVMTTLMSREHREWRGRALGPVAQWRRLVD